MSRHSAGRRGYHRADRRTWWDEWRLVVALGAGAAAVWLATAGLYVHYALTSGGGR